MLDDILLMFIQYNAQKETHDRGLQRCVIWMKEEEVEKENYETR